MVNGDDYDFDDDYVPDSNYGGYTQVDEDDALDLANNLTGDESCELLREAKTALENRIRGRKIDYKNKGQDPNHWLRITILLEALRNIEDAEARCGGFDCD